MSLMLIYIIHPFISKVGKRLELKKVVEKMVSKVTRQCSW